MTRSIVRHLIVLLAAFAAPALWAGTVRNIDFETPAPFANYWEHPWEAYSGYEATFEYGIREAPVDGTTSSTMYWGGAGVCGNCDSGPIRIFFSKPVKNIHFTLFNYFSLYNGPIHWDTREFFTGPPAVGMSITPLMNSRETRTITIPAEHVRYLDIAVGRWVALDDFSFEVEDAPQIATTYRVDLLLETDPAIKPDVAKTIVPGTEMNAQLALGTIFSVGITKRTPDPTGGPATITSIASTYTKSADKIAPALETHENLFHDSPVIQLEADPTTAVTDLTFAAVHLGTVKFTLTPFDIGAPGSVTLNLTIVRPPALGGEHNDWDKAIIDAAHERGIPPQLIKGQIQQESPGFNKDELRYEPCAWDWAHMSGLITQLPYSLYAMDAARSDADLTSTVDLRNRYLISDRPGGVYDASLARPIEHDDADVTIREIWDANNGPLSPQGYNQTCDGQPCGDQNWGVVLPYGGPYPADPDVDTDCGALNHYLQTHTYFDYLNQLTGVTAQTPTASSYGVMQVMYPTAVQTAKWSVPNPNRNIPGCPTNTDKCQSPRYLRDTTESLALPHGGSLFAGGDYDVRMYCLWGRPCSPTTTMYSSVGEFFGSFKAPFSHYRGNGAFYGINIVDFFQFSYLPVAPSQIFP